MSKLNNKLWLVLALLFALNCDDEANDSGKNTVNAVSPANSDSSAKVIPPVVSDSSKKNDSLTTSAELVCAYFNWGDGGSQITGNFAIQNEARLATFLERTRYDKEKNNGRLIKPLTHQPDFTKWTYFAFANLDDLVIKDISHGNDTVTINYIRLQPPYGWWDNPNTQYERANDVVLIYTMPFTSKTIKFTGILQYECGRKVDIVEKNTEW